MPGIHPLAYLIAVPIAVVIAVATGGSSPDLTGIAAIITAAIGVAGFLATLWRGKANNKRVEEVESTTSYLAGFESLIKRLQEEVEELHGELSTTRSDWNREKQVLEDQIGELKAKITSGHLSETELRSELLVLKGSIRGFLSADQYAEFQKHLE